MLVFECPRDGDDRRAHVQEKGEDGSPGESKQSYLRGRISQQSQHGWSYTEQNIGRLEVVGCGRVQMIENTVQGVPTEISGEGISGALTV